MIDGQKCGECIHWSRNPENEEQGQCRGTYPQVIVVPGVKQTPTLGDGGVLQVASQHSITIRPVFPPMLAEDSGCGQFYRVEKDNGE